MSLGLHDSARRRRRQRRWATIRALLILAALGGLGWFSYVAGKELAIAEVEALRQQLTEARDQITQLEHRNAQLVGEAAAARQTAEQWQRRYETDVPTGALAELLALAQAKLADGVSPERLSFVMDNAREPENCAGEPETKRFLVRTPIYQGGSDSVAFADGLITVSATGNSATDAAGRPEAWFDPAQPVRVVVTQVGGAEESFEGPLPLHFSIVRENSEHRFAARPGEQRGFLQVTADRCPYP